MPPRPGGPGVVLGLDGGTTSTLCVCIETPISDQLSDSPVVLGRAVAGSSNHNSIGGTGLEFVLCVQSHGIIYNFSYVHGSLPFARSSGFAYYRTALVIV
jgi:hypothetical protein